jgi:hypothetical protein
MTTVLIAAFAPMLLAGFVLIRKGRQRLELTVTQRRRDLSSACERHRRSLVALADQLRWDDPDNEKGKVTHRQLRDGGADAGFVEVWYRLESIGVGLLRSSRHHTDLSYGPLVEKVVCSAERCEDAAIALEAAQRRLGRMRISRVGTSGRGGSWHRPEDRVVYDDA